MWRVIAPVIIYDQTESPIMLGVLSVASYGPVLALSFFGGVLADRVPRRVLVSVGHALIAVNLAAVALLGSLGHLRASVVLVAAVVESVVYALAKPAMNAVVPELVAERYVSRAVALNITNFSVAQLIGPVIATLAMLAAGRPAAIGLAAIFYAPMAVALYFVTIDADGRGATSSERGAAMLRETWAALRRGVVARRLLSIALGSIALEGSVRVLAPQFAIEFGVEGSYSGFIVGAQAFGSVLAVVAVSRSALISNTRRITAAYLAMAAGVVCYAGSPALAIALVFAATVGLSQTVGFSIATAEIHSGTSPQARGRMMAFHAMALLGVRPLAGLLAGALSSTVGTRTASALFATFALASAVTAMRRVVPDRALSPIGNL